MKEEGVEKKKRRARNRRQLTTKGVGNIIQPLEAAIGGSQVSQNKVSHRFTSTYKATQALKKKPKNCGITTSLLCNQVSCPASNIQHPASGIHRLEVLAPTPTRCRWLDPAIHFKIREATSHSTDILHLHRVPPAYLSPSFQVYLGTSFALIRPPLSFFLFLSLKETQQSTCFNSHTFTSCLLVSAVITVVAITAVVATITREPIVIHCHHSPAFSTIL